MTLTTIGYEQARFADVVAALSAAKVDLLVDVRAVTASRRPGFSKNQLASGLEDAGIGYRHLRGLGTPAAGRAAARRGDIEGLRRIYAEQLETASARDDMAALVGLVRSGRRVCLLCYERAPEQCHRLIVANLVCEALGGEVRHLTPAPAL